MTPTIRRALALAAAASLLLSPTASPPASGGGRFINLGKVPKPKITGKQIVAGLADFVERFPLRQNGLPNNNAARNFLAKETKKLGYKTRIVKMTVGTPSREVDVVQAVKRGTKKPNEWIAFIAHYDTVAPDGAGLTYQGAYDDGSGTNMLRYFARAFAKVKTDRSIVMLWFDAEENGLLASRAYAERLKKQGQKIHAGLGFDMVGIGYPAPYCICVWHGPNPSDLKGKSITDYVNYKFLKFPKADDSGRWPQKGKAGVCNCGVNPRNSDESSFATQGYFTMRWAGMGRASYYPGYHQPWDTMDFIYQIAGSRRIFEKGTENTFLSAYYTAMLLDKL